MCHQKEYIETAVISQERLSDNILSMWVSFTNAKEVRPGQFAMLYTGKSDLILPRPISICETDGAAGALRFVYHIAGKGTAALSGLKAGDKIRLIAPLGNGFDMTLAENKERIAVVGGGIGTPPLLELVKRLSGAGKRVDSFLGFAAVPVLAYELLKYSFVYIATDSGSIGFHGNVIDLMKSEDYKPDLIYSCGPKPMLKAVAAFSAETGCVCQISMEERMACGIGVCVGCVTDIRENGLAVKKKICVDGPVFNAGEVLFRD